MDDRELLQQALEKLEFFERMRGVSEDTRRLITDLRERLAREEPETVMAEYKFQTYAAYKADGEMKIGVVPARQEPGTWREVTYDQLMEEVRNRGYEIRNAKITAPQPAQQPPRFPTMLRKMWSGAEVQQWINEHWTQPSQQPLTDEQILHRVDTHVGCPSPSYPLANSDWINFARAIEQAHGITGAAP